MAADRFAAAEGALPRLDAEFFGCGRFQAPGRVVDGPPVGRHDDVVVELLQPLETGGEPLPAGFGEDPLPDPVPLALESGAVEGGQDLRPQQLVEAGGDRCRVRGGIRRH